MKHPQMYKGVDLNKYLGKEIVMLTSYGEEEKGFVASISTNISEGITIKFLNSGTNMACVNTGSHVSNCTLQDLFDYVLDCIPVEIDTTGFEIIADVSGVSFDSGVAPTQVDLDTKNKKIEVMFG